MTEPEYAYGDLFHTDDTKYGGIPFDVKRAIMCSALDVLDAPIAERVTAIITEWHILYSAGYVSQPVPDEYLPYIRGGERSDDAERNPFADYLTGVDVAQELDVVPRTIRKHANRLNIGQAIGIQRLYSPEDVEALREVVSAGRPAARSETEWR